MCCIWVYTVMVCSGVCMNRNRVGSGTLQESMCVCVCVCVTALVTVQYRLKKICETEFNQKIVLCVRCVFIFLLEKMSHEPLVVEKKNGVSKLAKVQFIRFIYKALKSSPAITED